MNAEDRALALEYAAAAGAHIDSLAGRLAERTRKEASDAAAVRSRVEDATDALIEAELFAEAQRPKLAAALADHSRALDLLVRVAGRSKQAGSDIGKVRTPVAAQVTPRSRGGMSELDRLFVEDVNAAFMGS